MYTDKKTQNSPHILGNSDGKCANISPYMMRPLFMYDFAPDPSEFPYIWGKFSFLFYQCTHTAIYPLGNNKAISLVYISPNLHSSFLLLFFFHALHLLFFYSYSFLSYVYLYRYSSIISSLLLQLFSFHLFALLFLCFFYIHLLRIFSNYSSSTLFALLVQLFSFHFHSLLCSSYLLLLHSIFFFIYSSSSWKILLFSFAGILLFRFVRWSSL